MMQELADTSLLIMGGRRRPEFTVKEYAAYEGVSERTVWTWIAKKAIAIRKTPGGRVRVLSTLK